MEQVTEGTTSGSYQFEILDSTSTTGGRKTGLVFNTSGLTAYYVRAGGSATAITLATLAAANSAFSSGGFKEIDATNMPGMYRLDVPDAAYAAGAKTVTVTLKGATGAVQCSRTFQLNKVDLRDSVRGGMTALPNAAAGANGGLPLGDASGRVDLGKILGTAAATPATAGILDVNVKNMNNVAATSITTINANQGTTQPVNFTGTGASALAKSDMVDIAGAAVSATTAQIGTNMVQVNGQVASAAAGVTFPASIASPTNITAGTITTVTNLTNAPTAGDLTATMKTSVTTAATAATPALSAAGVQAIWDALTSALTTVGSVGKRIADFLTGDAFARLGAAGAGLTALGDTRIAHLDADVSSRLAAASITLTGGQVSVDAGSKTGTRLSATGVADIPVAVWAYVVEGTHTAVGYMRLFASALAGVLSGAATTTLTIKDIDNTKTRVTATVDSVGNRSAVATDET